MFDLSTKLNLFMEMHETDGVNSKQSVTFEFEGVSTQFSIKIFNCNDSEVQAKLFAD